jgi:hypothetical protein
MANEYQRMVKEQTRIDMATAGTPRPPLNTSEPPSGQTGLQAVPSFDQRDGLERRNIMFLGTGRDGEGGGTPLTDLFAGGRPEDSSAGTEQQADYERARSAAEFDAFQRDSRRDAYADSMRPSHSQLAEPVRVDSAESANRRLGATIFLVAIVLFAPPVQEWLSQFLPAVMVFNDEWPRVALRAGMMAAAVYCFKRFMAIGKGMCETRRSRT